MEFIHLCPRYLRESGKISRHLYENLHRYPKLSPWNIYKYSKKIHENDQIYEKEVILYVKYGYVLNLIMFFIATYLMFLFP